ncbi:MAG: hypothetical protein ABIQ16_26400 [Polyangiaceae bacterium]
MARVSSWFFRALLVLAVPACASAPARRAGPAKPIAHTAGVHDFPDGPTRRVRSRTLEFPIELSLPSRDTWQLSDGPTWLVAAHAASSSLLAVRTWRADRLVRRSECEAQARLVRPSVPIVRDDAVLERRALGAPASFDTELVVGVEPTAEGLSGYALAFGAGVGSCFAAVFTTAVSGSLAEQEVATRLGLAVDRILSGVRLRSVDERAVRHRLISSPRTTKAPGAPLAH